MEWTVCSPDMNPLKNFWNLEGKKINNRQSLPETVPEPQIALNGKREHKPQKQIQQLSASMRRRTETLCMYRRGVMNDNKPKKQPTVRKQPTVST